MEIPEYPEFRRIELEDKSAFDAAFSAMPPQISEYTFTNLYSWRIQHGFHVSRLQDLLLVVSLNKGNKEYYPPIGQGDVKGVILKILARTPEGRFVRVPEDMMASVSEGNSLKVEEDRDNSDYLFLTKDLIELKGRRYDAKRNFIKKFKSSYNYEYISVTESDIGRLLKFQDVWCVERGWWPEQSLQDESEAVKIMLEHFRQFSLKAGALCVNGSICAVCIAEALNPDTVVIHALKGARGMTGIYPVILTNFLSMRHRSISMSIWNRTLELPDCANPKNHTSPCAW